MSLSEGKVRHMTALSNKKGVIAAAAMDQRGSLQKSIATAKGIPIDQVTPEMMSEFKVAVSKVLTPHASAILLDPEFGLPAAKARSSNAGLLLAYEESGYDNTKPGRLPGSAAASLRQAHHGFGRQRRQDSDLLLAVRSTRRERHQARLHRTHRRRVRDICRFRSSSSSSATIPKAATKRASSSPSRSPSVVTKSMEEFSKPQYHVDVLKVEVPINADYVEGSSVYKGQKAYTRDEALDYFRSAADTAKKPFIYLSAGVGNAQFVEELNMAAEAGTDYSGVLCGRATWKEGIPVYAKQGAKALEDWLSTEGVKNIDAVNAATTTAKPWYLKAGVPQPAHV